MMLLLFSSPAFAFSVGLHMNGAWLEASSGWQASELQEGKPALDGPKAPSTHWYRTVPKISGCCCLVAGLCFLSSNQLFLGCPFWCASPAHILVTTTTKREFFSWIGFLLRSFHDHALGHGRGGDAKAGDASACPGTVPLKTQPVQSICYLS